MGTNSPSAGTSSSVQPAAHARSTSASWSIARTTPDRWASRCPGSGSCRASPWSGIDLVQQPSGLASDELDQGRDAEGPADVVHVEDQDHDARHHHDEGHDDRQTWHGVAVDVDLAEREDRVGERCHEQADGDLAWLVLQERLHDARRELTHRELYDDHRDGEDEGGKAHHRQRDGRQDRNGYLRSAGPLSRDHLIVAGPIDGERDDGQQDAAQHARDRYEPQARPNMVEEAGEHRSAPYPTPPPQYLRARLLDAWLIPGGTGALQA